MVDNYEEIKEKLFKLLSANGSAYYYNAMQEEAAELIKAISHSRRGKPDARNNLAIAFAQTQIILDILKICLFPINQEKELFDEIYNQELDKIINGDENG